MTDFLHDHMDLIEESQNVLLEIERALFTQRYNLNKKHFNILSIQSISMIYSVWEGFIQKTFQQYIFYLNSLDIPFNDFKDDIIIFHMENRYKQFYEYPKNQNRKMTFIRQLAEHFNSDIVLLYPNINTESNVSFEVLNNILKQFALEVFPEHWDEDYTYPNPNLNEKMSSFLRYRNGIAHGGDLSSEEKVTSQVYAKYKKLVTDLMYALHEKLAYAISHKSYLK